MQVGPEHIALHRALGAQASQDGVFGDLEGSFALRHVVDDLHEGVDSLRHLVVLRGHEGLEGVGARLVGGRDQDGVG